MLPTPPGLGGRVPAQLLRVLVLGLRPDRVAASGDGGHHGGPRRNIRRQGL